MKKALLAIAIILLLVGCGSTPTPTETVTILPREVGLTSAEQRVYEHIDRNYPRVEALYARMLKAIDRESLSGVVACSQEFVRYGKGWERLDWEEGNVAALENAYMEYMEGSRKFYRNWLVGINGGDTAQCATNAIRAEATIEKWGPRVEDELDAISNTH